MAFVAWFPGHSTTRDSSFVSAVFGGQKLQLQGGARLELRTEVLAMDVVG